MEDDEFSLPETLGDVLADRGTRAEFLLFLKGRLAEECLFFYESVERFEELTNQDQRNEMGKDIVLNFVSEDSIYWINVSAPTRTLLLNVEDFRPEAFNFAKNEIFHLMVTNFFEDFKSYLSTEEGRESFKRKNSDDILFTVLANLNVRDDLELPNDKEGKQKYLEQQIEKYKRNQGFLSISKLMRKGPPKSARARRASSGLSSRGEQARYIMKKRIANAYKRFFHGKKGRKMSFWEKYEE